MVSCSGGYRGAVRALRVEVDRLRATWRVLEERLDAIGRADLVEACRAQDSGIGRAMKPTKEAVVGVLAALQERRSLDLDEWTANQHSKVAAFVKQAARIGGLRATTVPDSTGLPFSRVCLTVDP